MGRVVAIEARSGFVGQVSEHVLVTERFFIAASPGVTVQAFTVQEWIVEVERCVAIAPSEKVLPACLAPRILSLTPPNIV